MNPLAEAFDEPLHGNFTLVTERTHLEQEVRALESVDRIAIDLETTGLNPRRDRVRLISLGTPGRLLLVDCSQVDPGPLMPLLSGRQLVGHNLSFDLSFLSRWGLEASSIQDTLLLSQLLHTGAGLRHSLDEVVRRELGIELSKELQQSDWSGPLTRAQLHYAAADVAHLLPLADTLLEQAREASVARAAEIETACIPAMVWMSMAGVPIDCDAWHAAARETAQEARSLWEEMDRAAPPALTLDFGPGFGRDWDNVGVIRETLAQLGYEIENPNELVLSSIDHPLADLLRRYRESQRLISTHGTSWLKYLDDGRVFPDWRQLGASSGRMACSSPNLQQIPRAARYRGCIAAPPGRVLVKADYSQIELRIAARIAEEERMVEAYQAGADLHTITARQVLQKEVVTSADRQLAKALNFGLLYGMGAEGFGRYARTQFRVNLSDAEAAEYREGFFRAYPGLRRWHHSVRYADAAETRTLAGRRHHIQPDTGLPMRLNLPVQGTGADGLKAALGLLWTRRSQCPGAAPVIACHDEIVIECPADASESASEWLRRAMIDGMAPLIDPVPVEVEVRAGRSWG